MNFHFYHSFLKLVVCLFSNKFFVFTGLFNIGIQTKNKNFYANKKCLPNSPLRVYSIIQVKKVPKIMNRDVKLHFYLKSATTLFSFSKFKDTEKVFSKQSTKEKSTIQIHHSSFLNHFGKTLPVSYYPYFFLSQYYLKKYVCSLCFLNFSKAGVLFIHRL